MQQPPPIVATLPASPEDPRRRQAAWRSAVALAALFLCAIAWLLARLIWLPFFFGLFFYLVAALLAGGASFRLARIARPVSTARIVCSALVISLAGILASTYFEYRAFVAGAGESPKFPEARNALINEGRSEREVDARAAEAFRAELKQAYPPGGLLGYVCWSIRDGDSRLTVFNATDRVTSQHRGLLWPLRTLMAFLLVAAGLWSSMEALRSPVPVSNVLSPGEEAAEDV